MHISVQHECQLWWNSLHCALPPDCWSSFSCSFCNSLHHQPAQIDITLVVVLYRLPKVILNHSHSLRPPHPHLHYHHRQQIITTSSKSNLRWAAKLPLTGILNTQVSSPPFQVDRKHHLFSTFNLSYLLPNGKKGVNAELTVLNSARVRAYLK